MTLLLALLGLAEARDRGFAPASSTADELGTALAPRRVAVIVGVDSYDDRAIPALKHAGADAAALAEALRGGRGGFDEVIVLTSPEMTSRAAILEALRRVQATSRREDALVVYFSGHGTRVATPEGYRRYLLPRDTRSGDLAGTALELESLQSWFADLPAGRKALVVDACFSGEGKSALVVGETGSDEASLIPGLADLDAGEAHLFATSAGRPSREDDRLGHGVYTWYLLDAMTARFDEADLDRDGVLTAYEAHDHARARTITHTDAVQVPEAAFRVLGEADLVLAGDPGHRRAREAALFYLYTDTREVVASASITVDGRDRGVFPGTLPVEPGKHHVVLKGADGAVLVDGVATFAPGAAYRADDIARLVQGPRRLGGVRAAAWTSPDLLPILGDGALGLEAYHLWRAYRGPVKGLVASASLGGGVAPVRAVQGGRLEAPRVLGAASFGVGWQGDFGRVRIRGGWAASAAYVPPSYPDGRPDPTAPEARSWEAGWWWSSTGPHLALGYVVRGPWAVVLHGRREASALDLWRSGHAETVWLTGLGLGVELAY